MSRNKHRIPEHIQEKSLAIRFDIAASVTKHRENRGWSKTTLASQAGVTRTCIIRVESGKNDPEISTLIAIYEALGFGLRLRFVPQEETA
jgi:DNA-binding XRE family transcriptional regulator